MALIRLTPNTEETQQTLLCEAGWTTTDRAKSTQMVFEISTLSCDPMMCWKRDLFGGKRGKRDQSVD